MAGDENPCCVQLKTRYSKLEQKRNALRQAVDLLEQQIKKIDADNLSLKKACEEERTKVESEREEKLKESLIRASLENEISSLKSEISNLQLKGRSGTQDGDGREAEINKLKRLLEEERIKVDSERKKSEAEKMRAAEAWEIVKSEKGKADKERKIASKKAEEYKLQLEKFKKEADEERKKAEAEKMRAAEAWEIVKSEKGKADKERKIASKKAEEYKLQLEKLKKEADEARSKVEEAHQRCEKEKHKAAMEKKRADAEMSKAEDQRKLAEANEKKAMVEKARADHLFKELEEHRQKIEKLQKEMDELVSSRKQVEALAVPPDKSLSSKTSKKKARHQAEKTKREADDGQLVMELLKSAEVNKKDDVGKKVLKEKKHADLGMAKPKPAKADRKKTMQEKCHADQIFQQLEKHRLGIEKLQKELSGLLHSGKLDQTPTVPPGVDITQENMKLLKKKLKFEKKQVKHAKQMAKIGEDRNNILQQELGRLKQEFFQFSHRVDMLDNFLSRKVEGTHDVAKDKNFSDVLQLNLRRRSSGVLEPFQTCLLSDKGCFDHYCTARNSSDPFSQIQEHNVPLLPRSGGNSVGFISGIDSESESLLGGSDQKMLQSSAINSSMASFSDRQLMGSQERGAFSVTTSTKLAEENSNPQPTCSRFSHETTKMRYNGEFAVVAETCVRDPLAFDVVAGDNGHSRKRKRVQAAVESIENLHSEDKNSHLQVGGQLPIFNDESNRNINKPLEEGSCLVSDLQGHPKAKNHGSCKKPRVSHKKEVVVKHLCHPDRQKRAEKLGTKGNDEANPSTLGSALKDHHVGGSDRHMNAQYTSDRINQDALLGFEKLVNGDCMKLLDLDNSADEAFYRRAIETPLSPMLPEIDYHVNPAYEVDNPNCLEESFNEMLSNEKHSSVPFPSFDVVNLEIDSNQCKFITDTHQSPLLLKCDGLADSLKKPEKNKNANPSPIYHEGKTCSDQIFGSDAEEGMPNIPVSINEGATSPSELDGGAPVDNIPEFCVVFSDTKENRCISRILCAIRTCVARCHLVSQSDWMVKEIMHALMMEVDLLPKEKVCVLFSLLLHNLSGTSSKICENIFTGESICCLDSFSGQINAVMCNVEMRNLFANLCHLDELLSLIEEFIIDKKVLVYNNVPSESLVASATNSRFNTLVDGVDRIMSFETASTHQLVAASIILASVCAATDHIAFICEASYNIFQMHRSDSSLLLTILHVFAHFCGEKYFTLSNYCLIMTVIKSLVTLSERQNLSVKSTPCLSSQSKVHNEFPPCIECPFSRSAASVDIVISLLLHKLQVYAIPDTVNQELIKSDKPLESGFLSHKDKAEKDSDIREAFCVHSSMKCDMLCCLNNFEMSASHSGSDFSRTCCHLIDIVSLVELVTSNMSWEWTCDNVVPCLLKILNLCDMDDISAAIIILLGQLGRIGVDAGGYEDIGVESLRCGLHSYLCKIISRKTCLPLQISTIVALLGLLSVELKEFVQNGEMDLTDVTGKSAVVHDIRHWFSSLSKEQQSFSVSIIQSLDVHKNENAQCSYRLGHLGTATAL